MKLRIKGNAIRLRLTKPEVEIFHKKGYLEEVTDFGTRQFTYAVNRIGDAIEITADFADNVLVVHIPTEIADDWCTDDSKVGIEHTADLDGFRSLFIAVEKDFKCVGREGDQETYYDNPKSGC